MVLVLRSLVFISVFIGLTSATGITGKPAKFLFTSSTRTVTAISKKTSTILSKCITSIAATPCGRRRKRRFAKTIDLKNSGEDLEGKEVLMASASDLENGGMKQYRTLFNLIVFTTTTVTVVTESATSAYTVGLSFSCTHPSLLLPSIMCP